jgi:hypothetical protein
MSRVSLCQPGGPPYPHEQGGPAQSQSHVTTDVQPVSISWCGVHAGTCGLKLARQSQSYITTESQSASLSWCQAPIWDSRPIVLVLSLIVVR